MSWTISWLAVQGAQRSEVFDHLGLIETGAEAFPGDQTASFCFREFPNDWLVSVANDLDWASSERLVELSEFGLALACQFEDQVEMTSSLAAAQDGQELWCVFHNSVKSVFKLDVKGEPPAVFSGLRDAAFEAQRREGGEDSQVDFVHDVALDLGKAICGFRAEDEEQPFSALESVNAGSESKPEAGRGFFSRLFASRKGGR